MSIFKGIKDEIWLACEAALPTEKNKDKIEQFRIKIEVLKETAAKELMERVSDKHNSADIASELSKIIRDWDVKGPDDEPVEFNPENLESIWEEGPYAVGIIEAWHQLRLGKKTYRRLHEKN